MNRLVKIFACSLLITPLLSAQELSGEDIINRVNEIFNPETSHGISTMTITTSSGNERTFKFESWSKGAGEKNLVRYLEPSREKFEGSDFSYEDMGGGDAFITDYTSKRLEDEEKSDYECYKVELIKKADSDMSYSRIIMWIIKENFCPVFMEYYEEDNPKRLQKTLTQYDIKIIDGLPVAMNSVMRNVNDNTETKTSVIDIEFNIDLDDEMFTERSLKK